MTSSEIRRLIAVALLPGLLITQAVFAEDKPDEVVGKIGTIQGDVTLNGGVAKAGMPLKADDRVETLVDGRAILVIAEKNVIHLDPRTTVRVEAYRRDLASKEQEQEGAISLEHGAIKALLAKERDVKKKFLIRTKTATLGVRGTKVGAVYCEEDCDDSGSGNQASRDSVDDQIRLTAAAPGDPPGGSNPLGGPPGGKNQGVVRFTLIEGVGQVVMHMLATGQPPGPMGSNRPPQQFTIVLTDGQSTTIKLSDLTQNQQQGRGPMAQGPLVIVLDTKTLNEISRSMGIPQNPVNTLNDVKNVMNGILPPGAFGPGPLLMPFNNIPQIPFDPVANGGAAGLKKVHVRLTQ